VDVNPVDVLDGLGWINFNPNGVVKHFPPTGNGVTFSELLGSVIFQTTEGINHSQLGQYRQFLGIQALTGV
jgi:hypothetical protein